MLNFVPPLPEKKKKREDIDDDEEVRLTCCKPTTWFDLLPQAFH